MHHIRDDFFCNREWRHAFFIAVLVAGLFTLLVNIETLKAGITRGEWHHAFYSGIQDEDQRRYLYYLHEVLDGYPLMGNPGLKNHRFDVVPVGFINEWIAAPFFSIPGISFAGSVAYTDFVVCFFIILITFVWLRSVLRSTPGTIAVLVITILTVWGPDTLIRDTTKFGMLFPAAYLCLLFVPEKENHRLRFLRGSLIGLMTLSYYYHWSAFAAAEGVMAIITVFHKEISSREKFVRIAYVFAPFLFFALLYAARLKGIETLVLQQTYPRYGVIDTRGLVAPLLQIKLLVGIIPLLIAYKTRVIEGRRAFLLLCVLLGSLCAVNSNLVTGHEADFNGHYGRVVGIFTVVAIFLLYKECVSARVFKLSAIGVSTCLLMVWIITSVIAPTPSFTQQWKNSDYPVLMQWLNNSLPKESVVLASMSTSNFIQVFTSHYVNTAEGTKQTFVSDQELYERYLIQTAFFPQDYVPIETGGNHVFGLYAGQKFARERSMFQLRTFFQKPFPKTLPDYFLDQDLRRRYEQEAQHPNASDVRTWLSKYPPDILVTSDPVPAAYQDLFKKEAEVGKYSIYGYKGLRVTELDPRKK